MLNCRALFLSDVHLGCKDCQADYLLRFLKQCRARKIYLLGDIVDLWAMQKQVFWKASQNEVVRQLLKMAEQDTEIIYVPGNHDEALRLYVGKTFGSIHIQLRSSHTTLQGKRLLLLHGDEFDKLVRLGGWHGRLGDHLYDLLLFLHRWCNRIRRLFGYRYFSLAAYIKSKVPGAHARYRAAAVARAKHAGYDGIVCGHIHHSEICLEGGILYCNDGDWIDSCTALLERQDSSLELYHCSEHSEPLAVWPIKIALEKVA
jgi:UDP-2,3-diacylglucosamine pyrophosphatase LpxH